MRLSIKSKPIPFSDQTKWIQFLNVTLERGGKRILKEVSFSCGAGKLIGLLGVNGAGKTSLLYSLTGWLKPVSGKIMVGGIDWLSYKDRDKLNNISFCPQNYNVPQGVLVKHTLEMGSVQFASNWLTLKSNPEKERLADKLSYWTKIFNIQSLLNENFDELSGGEQRRVLLARAFARSTDLTLLDEPLANLDLKGQLDLALTLRRIVQEDHQSVIWTLHDWNLAMEFCDQIIILHDQQCIYHGNPEGALTETSVHPTLGEHWKWVRNPCTKAPMLAYRGDSSSSE